MVRRRKSLLGAGAPSFRVFACLPPTRSCCGKDVVRSPYPPSRIPAFIVTFCALVAVAAFSAGADEATFPLEDYLEGKPVAGESSGSGGVARGLKLGRSLESRVASDLQMALRDFLEQLRSALYGGDVIATVVALEPAYQRLQAQHLLFLERLDRAARQVAEFGVRGDYEAAIQEQRRRYEERVETLFGALDEFYAVRAEAEQSEEEKEQGEEQEEEEGEEEPGLLDEAWQRIQEYYDLYSLVFELEGLLADTQEPARPHLRASTLPYRSRNAPVLAPERPSPVVPAYERGGGEPATEDLRASPSVPFSDVLRSKAAELDHDPIRLFNFVRSEIRTEWYAGAVKGAELTLLSGAGNDVDQASLLVALFRLSGVPARFVHGVVEIPVEALANAFGTDSQDEAVEGLRLAGVPHEPVIRGGRVAAVKVERTWVTIKLPYSNYRGTVVDPSGDIWLPLDPAFKTLDHPPVAPLLAELGIDPAQTAADYLAQDRAETLLDELRVSAKTALELADVEFAYDDVVAAPAVRAGDTGYLPTTLPYAVEQVSFEGAQLGPELRQEVLFQVHSDDDPTSPVILEARLPLFEVTNRRITLSYIPASEDDHELVRSFGGLLNTPAFLIRIRPQLKLGGQLVATASEGMQVGVAHRLVVTLEAPGLSETVTKSLLSGSYHAIALSHSDTVLTLDAEDDPADTESAAARILSQVALRFQKEWEDAERELAALSGASLIRPLPALTFASNAVDVDFVLDQPQQLLWEGVELDVGLRLVEAVRRTDAALPLPAFYRLSALEGSILEHHLFERDLAVAAVSADRLVALANEAGLEVVHLDAQNVDAELPRLAHPEEVKALIEDWVHQGLTVSAPIDEITYRDWRGFAWIAQDEVSGAAGYFLSGEIAGGATADAEWANLALQRNLESPYTPETNDDALAAAAVIPIPGTDRQATVVGQPLPRPLAVLVVDAEQRPVVNAMVTFTVAGGAGGFDQPAGVQSLQVLTGPDGIARAHFFLGTSTAANPVFIKRNDGDRWPSKALQTFIDVSVAAFSPEAQSTITLKPPSPFAALGFPGAPASFDPFPFSSKAYPLSSHVFEVTVFDAFGNPISNQEVTFRYLGDTGAGIPGFQKGHVEAGTQFGDWATTSTSHTSGAYGSLVTGNGFVTYNYEIAVTDQLKTQLSVDLHVENRIVVSGLFNSRRAAKVGEQYPQPFFFRVERVQPTEGNLDLAEWVTPVSLTDVSFDVTNGGAVTGFEILEGGEVHFFLRAGLLPASIVASAEGTLLFPGADETPFHTSFGAVNGSFYALDPKITEIVPLPLGVDGAERTLTSLEAKYDLAQPGAFQARRVDVALMQNGQELRSASGNALRDAGAAHFERGLSLPAESSYQLQVVTDPGTTSEVRSDPVDLPTARAIIRFVQKRVRATEDVDALNQRSCPGSLTLTFALNEEAVVRLEATGLGADPGVLIDDQVFPAGAHLFVLDAARFSEGLFEFSFSATSTAEGRIETETGEIEVDVVRRAVPPVGHAMLNEVDLFDGGLSLDRTEIALPGRGPELEFTRTYKSTSNAEGFLGLGWSHNLDSKLYISTCNTVLARGITFLGDTNGYHPEEGSHATLRPSGQDFDLYTKDGTRYHFRRFTFDRPSTRHLEFIQDTNGNLLKFGYNPQGGREPELALVEDSAGRKLEFTYGWMNHKRLLRRLDGPDGFRTEFHYDLIGRLRRVVRQRGGLSKTELYDYATDGPEFLPDPEACPPEQLDCINQPMPGYATPQTFLLRTALTGMTDPRGGRTEYAYEQAPLFAGHTLNDGTLLNNFVVRVDHPEGGATHLQYSSRAIRTGELETTATDPLGNVTLHRLNQYGSPLSIQQPLSTRSMVWSPDHIAIVQEIDENGFVKNIDRDDAGNIIREQVEDFAPVTRTFATLGGGTIKNRIEIDRDRNGNETRYGYDARGNLTHIDFPDGTFEEHVYAANGDLIRTFDHGGNVTEFGYDEFGNLEFEIDALGNVTRHKWNQRGLRTETRDALGNTTRYVYDDFNRLIQKIDPLGHSRFYEYDERDNKITEIDEEGGITRWEYDQEGRVTRTINAEGDERTNVYDVRSNLVEETDWNGNLTTHEYDANNRRIRTTQPEGRITEFDYDPAGNLIEERRQLGRVTNHAYDALNRRIETTDALEGTTTFEYDDHGNRIAQTDPLVRRTEFEYDEMHRLRFTREPLGRTTESQYDANGNESAVIDPNGNVTQKQYDALNRVITQIDGEGNRTTFEYDAVGNLVRQIDPRGSVTQFAYDPLNREIRKIDAQGNIFEKEYDAVGNVVLERWPNGNAIESTYDALNRLVELGDALGLKATSEYDANGNLVRSVDGRGSVTTHEYDGLNERIRSDLPEARTVLTEYDVLGNVTREVNARSHERRLEYDLLDRVVRDIDALGNEIENEYDAVGNLIQVTDRRSNVTINRYDALNRLVEVEDAEGQLLRTAYDAFGNVVERIDKRGIAEQYTYDANHRLLTSTRAGLVTVRNEYDEAGNRLFATDANGNVMGFEYDALNRVVQENRPLASIRRIFYNAMGDKMAERDPEGRFVNRSFDLRSRKISETVNSNALGSGTETTLFEYDANGNIVLVTRPEGKAWEREYDRADRLVLIRDPLAGVTQYSYDANGNRTSQVDALERTTLLRYDVLDRLEEIEFSNGAIRRFAYDENGNKTEETAPNGVVLELSYDTLNRETLRTYTLPPVPTGDDLQSVASGYDANDNLLQVVESYHGASRPDRVTSFEYDEFDRQIATTDAFGERLEYAYDANGNRTQLTDPDGKVTRYSFDALNRVISIVNGAGVTTYEYDRSNRVRQIRYPNGTRAERFYDDAGRVRVIENTQNGAVVSRFEYLYDLNGNRAEQREINGGGEEVTSYQYDALDRLGEVVHPDGLAGPSTTVTYAYDAAYNRTDERVEDTASGSVIEDRGYVYDERDRLTQIDDRLDPTASISYAYDVNGNQTEKVSGGVATQFVYDARDHLRSVTAGGSSLGLFLYDFRGLRVEKTGERGTERSTYDDRSLLVQSDAAGNTIAKYDYGGQRLVSLTHRDEGTSFYLFDALGSVVNQTNQDGSIRTRHQYDAWGALRASVGASWNRFGFTGHEHDAETGLIYFQGRYYDPETGRFLSLDPVPGTPDVAPSLHRYLYVFANPTLYVDPTGEFPIVREIVEGMRNQVKASEESIAYLNKEHEGLLGTAKGFLLTTTTTLGKFGNNLISAAAQPINVVDLVLDAGVTGSANLAQAIGADRLAPGLFNSQAVQDSRNRIEATCESAGRIAVATVDFIAQDDLGAALLESGKSVVESSREYGKGLLSGDPEKWNAVGAFFGEMGTGAAATKILRGLRGLDELGGIAEDAAKLRKLADDVPTPRRLARATSTRPGQVPAPRGGRGPATAWQGFDEALSGGPVRDLTTSRVRVTNRAIDVVERHIARFGPDAPDEGMVARLRRIAAGELKATAQDLNFYTHELREFVRYRRLGFESGLPKPPPGWKAADKATDFATEVWRNTHTATLDDYGFPLKRELELLYHPSVRGGN